MEVNYKQYQQVTLTFSNGKRGVFVGPAILEENEVTEDLKVIDIKITAPEDLDDDMKFEKLKN